MMVRREVGGRLLALGLILGLAALGCQSDGSASRSPSPRGGAPRGQKSGEPAKAKVVQDQPGDGRETEPSRDELVLRSPSEGDPAILSGGADPSDEEAPAKDEPPARKEKKAPRSKAQKSPGTPGEVLRDMEDTQRFNLTEAEYRVKLGDEAYSQLDYKTAMEEYRRALDLNPALSDAREKWARCGLVLGVRSSEVQAVRREFVEGDRVRKEQHLADSRLGLKEAQELLKEGDLQNAEKKFRKIYEELLWFEYPVDISDLRKDAKQGIQVVEERKKRESEDLRSKLEKMAGDEREKELEREKRAKDQQVRDLVRRAADYIRLKDFDKAVDSCKRILEINPDHTLARYWLQDIKSQQTEQKRVQVYRDRVENRALVDEGIAESAIPQTENFVFPGEKDWAVVRKRKEAIEGIAVEDPDWVRKIRNTLDNQRLTFSFEQRSLKDVVPFLSEQTGVNIMVDPAIKPEEMMVDLTAKDMPAKDALNQILTQVNLTYTFKENFLFITEKEKAKGIPKFLIYNVSDILNKIRDFEGPEIKLRSKDEMATGSAGTGGSVSFSSGTAEEEGPIDSTALIDLIKEGSGGEEAWTEDYKIDYHKGQLLVTATKELHEQVMATLKNLREDADLFVVVESRFIDISDDFLEDIGLDSRALGVGSNWGTPYGSVINDSSTGGNDIGFVKQGSPVRDVTLIMGQDRYAGRIQHIIDGFTGLIQGTSLRGGEGGIGGLTAQATWLEPFQLNVIFRAVQEKSDVRQLTAPVITAHNGQRVYVSVITQRAYIADYELVSGGTGFAIIEVADPVVQTFQEGVILDVSPVITPDKRYVTLDVRPTLASLIGGVISTIHISLGGFVNVAFQVPIGVPKIALQQSFTSVTVPNGGTVLLGGFKSLLDAKFSSYLPILGKIPIIKFLFSRNGVLLEKRSLVILITARIVDLRADERSRYNE